MSTNNNKTTTKTTEKDDKETRFREDANARNNEVRLAKLTTHAE